LKDVTGVNSGLVVNTTATWVPEKQCFVIHSPNEGSVKNWISQGYTADKAALIADLRIDGKSFGPHGFLMYLRVYGKVVPGVSLGDMGRKTTGNDLDNAWIKFDNV
jgi:acyl-CoA oxidase